MTFTLTFDFTTCFLLGFAITFLLCGVYNRGYRHGVEYARKRIMGE